MWKRLLSLVILISLFSFTFCLAFDVNGLADEWLPKITECWNNILNWVNNVAKPWLETHLGLETRQEFEKELTEAIRDVPVVLGDLWNKIKDLIK